jgi:hypothetical protein
MYNQKYETFISFCVKTLLKRQSYLLKDLENSLMGHFSTFQNTEFCLYERKFVTNISFATVRLINHSWDRIKCLASCFINQNKIKKILKLQKNTLNIKFRFCFFSKQDWKSKLSWIHLIVNSNSNWLSVFYLLILLHSSQRRYT